jgi:poly(A) polymerase
VVLQTIDRWRPVSFPLWGRDALALGLSRGPAVGRLLREVESWWEEGGYRAGRTECLDRLKVLISERQKGTG